MPKTTKSKFSLNKLNYYAMFDTGDKLDHICVMLEKIVDDLDGQDVVKVEIDNKDNTLVRIFADQERDQLKAENEKLREALREIASLDNGNSILKYYERYYRVFKIAYEALNEVTP